LLKRTEEAADINFYDYDLICIGFPSYQWSPPKPVDKFLKSKFAEYRRQGRVKVGAPKVPGKNALIFCTYSGPHTGINEAILLPCGMSGTWWVSTTAQRKRVPGAGWGISGGGPTQKT
jgi:hypothetical protein